MGKKCDACRKKCSGNVLKANEKYFHVNCFKCSKCGRNLNESGFYPWSDNSYLCPDDFRTLSKEGTSATQSDLEQPVEKAGTAEPNSRSESLTRTSGNVSPINSPANCAECDQPINSGQILLALGLSWHVYCFKCSECAAVLHGEYMTSDNKPLCIRDYNEKFGVKCNECQKFIAGKVLQAGGYKFHPTCAKCSRCGNHFGDGEEMYMQGDEIWHPSCEHSRTTENIAPAARTASLNRSEPKYQSTFGQHLTYMYLLPEAKETYLRHPDTNPKEPSAPQFHVPQGPIKIRKSRLSMLKTGMQRLAEDLERDVPRAKSPHMDNEEPIELAHYPAAKLPDAGTLPAIERDDFPAPPYPYAVEELKRRLSTSSIENEISDDDYSDGEKVDEDKLIKNVQLLEKYNDSSIAHVIKQNIEDSHKKQRLPLHWDPRNASRTPSGKKNPQLRFRYDVPINASPSRHLNRPKPWTAWAGTMPANQGSTLPCFHLPESRTGTMRAATLPTGYAYSQNLSLEQLATNSLNSVGELPSGGPVVSGGAQLRSSLPDMSKPAQQYDISILQTTNKDLPDDVDRQHLERHLSRDAFEKCFGMSPIEFYKLPEWKRINLKRKVKLF